jgi:hypothetical protein
MKPCAHLDVSGVSLAEIDVAAEKEDAANPVFSEGSCNYLLEMQLICKSRLARLA